MSLLPVVRQPESGYEPPNRSELSLNAWQIIKGDEEKFNQIRASMSKKAKERVRLPHSPEAKAKMSEIAFGKKQNKVTCPYCGKEGGAATMPRWHFDNCKFKQT